ncbi:MAG: hypothetical protein Q4D96_10340 [Propionibacteriaceae bacterium]|nr:hypothetical protein [Propionibacteriaceae bacterium]
MILLIPLFAVSLGVLIVTRLFAHRLPALRHWCGGAAAAGCGMAAVYLSTSSAHFLEPQRSGLEAIVPVWSPVPAGLAVTASGIVEITLAVGLLAPRLRVASGYCSALFLILVLPANVVAASGVAHPAAPDTPLLPRLLLQLVLIGFSLWTTGVLSTRKPAQPGGCFR